MSWLTVTACCIFISCVLGFDRNEALDDLDKVLDDTILKKISNILATKHDVVTIKCEDDAMTASSCPHWKAGGACRNNRRTMRKYCRKTCDDCRAESPPLPKLPKCASKAYGCCWDNVTIALGPTEDIVRSRCHPCLESGSKTFCNNWKMDCGSKMQGQGDVMRKMCPQTCGVPCDYNLNINKCRDDPANAQNCISWYEDGKCTTEQSKMRVLCPSTCGFCHAG